MAAEDSGIRPMLPIGPGPTETVDPELVETRLKRTISTRMLVVFVVGDMIGAGIYALVGEVGGEVGGAIWSAFAVALALATLTAFAYAELVTKYPRAAGSALYVHKAFGLQALTFMVAFAVMTSGITSASTLSLAFAGDYFTVFFDTPAVPIALGFILVIAAINLRGISESVKVNVVLTAVELVGLLLIVIAGIVAIAGGDADVGRNFEFNDDPNVVLAILGGATLAFYALIGFEDSVNVAEETKNPVRAFPKALFGGLAIAGGIYLLVTFSASSVVPTADLVGSSGPLLEVVQQGPMKIPERVFSVIALLAVANGALINMVMASRLVYGMAEQGVVPSAFSLVLKNRRTPWVAILLTTAIACGLIATGDLGDLADTTVLLLLCTFVLVNVSVLVLKRDKVAHEHFTTPVWVPVLGAIVSIVLIAQNDAEVFLRAGILLGLGLVVYVINRLIVGPPEPSAGAPSAADPGAETEPVEPAKPSEQDGGDERPPAGDG